MALPLIVLLFKLHKWNESAKFFDGSSIGELIRSATVVGSSSQPARLLA